MVGTIPETVGFAGLWLLGLADQHVPQSAEYQVPVIQGITDNPDFIDAANSIGQLVQHWTINDGDEMVRLLELGTDGIMTDDVSLGVEVFAPYRPPPTSSRAQQTDA